MRRRSHVRSCESRGVQLLVQLPSATHQNRMSGSIGCWGGDDHGEPEHAPDRETGGTEPDRPTAAATSANRWPREKMQLMFAVYLRCRSMATPVSRTARPNAWPKTVR
jgi:hypothetical protein